MVIEYRESYSYCGDTEEHATVINSTMKTWVKSALDQANAYDVTMVTRATMAAMVTMVTMVAVVTVLVVT